jgi:hypothetical protein
LAAQRSLANEYAAALNASAADGTLNATLTTALATVATATGLSASTLSAAVPLGAVSVEATNPHAATGTSSSAAALSGPALIGLIVGVIGGVGFLAGAFAVGFCFRKSCGCATATELGVIRVPVGAVDAEAPVEWGEEGEGVDVAADGDASAGVVAGYGFAGDR